MVIKIRFLIIHCSQHPDWHMFNCASMIARLLDMLLLKGISFKVMRAKPRLKSYRTGNIDY
jgi:hypothetical protein